MRKFSTGLPVRQSGFTMVELVIVIIIIGILAAVATIKMGNVTDAANKASNKAVLGMVKSAWSAAYAVAKGAPTVAQVVAQTGDPTCTAGTGIVLCPVNWLKATGAAGNLSITVGADPITSSSGIACTTGDDCD